MPQPERETAELVFARHLERIEAGAAPDFAALLLEYPQLASDLRRLHSDWQLLGDLHEGSAVPSFSFFSGAEPRSEPAPGLSAGKVVGEYELVRFIDKGGMGEVWEARQRSLGGRRVALKFMRPERVTARQLELFEREARAGGRLNHTGVVTVFDHGESNGLSWIAMEFVNGCWTLRDFLDEMGKADELPQGYDRRVAEFVARIADAIEAAHRAGVIHRDLKPQNVLITQDERPKITDFGLARITDEIAVSMTGDFAGTYFYMSPEQVAARRAGIDHRTDVFSLGVVLYELLTLQRPFQGDTTHQVAAQILAKDPVDPRTLRSRTPRDLAVIAQRALEKDPDKRFPTMEEFAADLRRWLGNEPIRSRSPRPWERLAKWVWRNPSKSAVGAIVAVAMLAISDLALDLSRSNEDLSLARRMSQERERQARVEAERTRTALREAQWSAYRALLGEARQALDRGSVGNAKRSLTQCAPDLRNWEWDHLALACDQSSLVVRPERAVLSVEWAADGERLLLLHRTGVGIYDPETGDSEYVPLGELYIRRWSTDMPAFGTTIGWIPGISVWSPVADRYAFCTTAGDLRLGSLDAHDEFVEPTCEESIVFAEWSPDGDRLALVDSSGGVRVVDASTGRELARLEVTWPSTVVAEHVRWSPDGELLAAVSPHGAVQVTRWRSGEVLFARGRVDVRPGFNAHDVVWGPDSEHFAIGSYPRGIDVYSAEGRLVGHLGWNPDQGDFELPLPSCMDWRKGRVAVAGADWLRTWVLVPGESDAGAPRSELRFERAYGEQDGAIDLEWSPDGQWLATAFMDGSVRLWGETGAPVELIGNDITALAVRWAPDGDRLLSFTTDEIRVWHARRHGTRSAIGAQGWGAERARDLRVSTPPLGKRFVIVSDEDITLWADEAGRPLMRHEGSFANDVAWSPDGLRFAVTDVAWRSPRVHLYDGVNGRRIDSFWTPEHAEGTLSLASGSERVAVGGGSSPYLWTDGVLVVARETSEPAGRILSIAWEPGSDRLWTGSECGTVKAWNALPLEERGAAQLQGVLRTMRLSPNADYLACGLEGGRVALLQTNDLLRVCDIDVARGDVQSLRFSPDGARLAVLTSLRGDWGRAGLGIWDVASGHRASWLSHSEPARPGADLAWSPDGSRLATGHSLQQDSHVRLWDAATGDLVGVFDVEHPKNTNGITSIAWSPSGSRLLIADDESVHVLHRDLGAARPWWESEEKMRRADEHLRQLIAEHVHDDEVLQALERDSDRELARMASHLLSLRGGAEELWQSLVWQLLGWDPVPVSEVGEVPASRWRAALSRWRSYLDENAEDVRRALPIARALAERHPDHWYAQRALAWALVANNRFPEARSLVERMAAEPNLLWVGDETLMDAMRSGEVDLSNWREIALESLRTAIELSEPPESLERSDGE